MGAGGDHGGQLVVGVVGLVGEGLRLLGRHRHTDADQPGGTGRGADDLQEVAPPVAICERPLNSDTEDRSVKC